MGRAAFLLLACSVLAACGGRPLTEAERGFAATVYGDTLDPEPVRLVKGAVVGLVTVTVPPRPRTTCQERLYPPMTEPVVARFPAFALAERVHYIRPLWSEDYLAGWPGTLPLADAMRLAHELTHVWQWQNRAETGYHPARAAAEHQSSADPYLFEERPDARFSDYGWEQQGAIVEEFVCCRALDPEGARTRRLARLLSEPFPGLSVEPAVHPQSVRLPWDGAEIRGICGGA